MARMPKKWWSILLLSASLLVSIAALQVSGWIVPVRTALFGKKTVTDRVNEFGPAARQRWSPRFDRAGLEYPPARVTLVGLKAEKRLDVYAEAMGGAPRFIRSYRILAASGGAGPKLRRGDRQVPEGIYPIESLNPNSRFHVALRVGYPNAFDREMAERDGRSDLGSDIMIHGKSASVGCLAMGDEAAEDLFVLAAEVGIEKITLLLVPCDWRLSPQPVLATVVTSPAWTAALYEELRRELLRLPIR